MRAALLSLLALAATAHAEEPVDFAREVLPLLRERCFDCHAGEHKGRARKPKAGLFLDRRSGLLLGARGGPAVRPGAPERSPLFVRASRPADHEEVMPPSGDVFDATQLALIERWIREGAKFGAWTGAAAAPPKKAPEPRRSDPFRLYRELAEGLGPPPGGAVEAARKAGARVEPVFPGSPLLRVEFVSDPARIDDAAVRALGGLRRHVAILGLAGTRVGDASLDGLTKMERLVRLDLQRTKITDGGLARLRPPQLRRLNVYGTALGDAAVPHLAKLVRLETLYVWNTKLTGEGVARLRRELFDCRIHYQRDLPKPEDGEPRRRRRRN